MSKFYDRTIKASHDAGEKRVVETSIVDRWLEGIHETVADQIGGVEPAPTAAPAGFETAAAIAPQTASESDLTRCRRAILRIGERIMLPGAQVEQHAVDAYRTLRTRLMRRGVGTQIRVIAVSGAAQGDGKTLSTINLGLTWSQLMSPKILLIDADLRSAGMSDTLDLPSGPGLADILTDKANYQESILSTQIPNLYVIAAGTRPESAPELFSMATWKSFIHWASTNFDLILLDCPPMLPFPDYELISASADGVIAVARQHETDASQFKAALAITDPKKILGVVFNAVENAPAIDYNTYMSYSKRRG